MADSVFKDVESAPAIEVFQLSKMFQDSNDPNKVNLGVGAYRSDEGKPWVLPVVSTAELQMANDRTLNHEYLPVAGLPDFRAAALRLLLGSNHTVLAENRVEGFQCLGGTGALRLAAEFLKKVLGFDIVYTSSPTWGNHKGVFKAAGFTELREYRYWNSDSRGLNFDGMCEDLMAAPVNAVVILHAVAHNPTGVDPTKEQWMKIAKICQEKQVFVLLDCAYQGFASGSVDEDAWASRYFADQNMDLFIAQSFSKNFGLYNERTGNLAVITKNIAKLPEIRSQMEICIRVMWSNPPNHGARVVATVLNNKAYYEDWKGQLLTMADRIKKMRQELVDNLKKLGTPGNWDHIVKQIGMFSYTGLSAKQVEYMLSKHVFMLGSGRISIAGLSPKNVQYVATCIDEAVRGFPTIKLSPTSGDTYPEKEPISFVEFARRKLHKPNYQVIKTSVVIDGIIFNENPEAAGDHDENVEDLESVKSFVKIQMEGSLSSLSSSINLAADKDKRRSSAPEEDQLVDLVIEVTSAEDSRARDFTDAIESDLHSSKNEAGTLRSTIKTFKTRSQQTLQSAKEEDDPKLKGVPARFEGTMLTPIYFEGRMMTPEKLDTMLAEASKKKNGLSIPVSFEGGMLTAAFKAIAVSQSVTQADGSSLKAAEGETAVPVKFSGRLQGMNDTEGNPSELPVSFNGTMATKSQSRRKSSLKGKEEPDL